MIVDTLGNIDQYAVLGPRFAIGIGFLKRLKLPLHETRIELDGDNVFAMIQNYAPQGVESRSFEAHRTYADIQFVARGGEIIYYSPLSRLRRETEYSAASDSALFTGPDDQPIIMMPESFAIFFPNEGHKPGCILRNEEPVTKIVVKVRV